VSSNHSKPHDLLAKTALDYDSLCKSLSKPRLLVFSLPHGGVGDKVLEGLMPHLERDDIILDCGNERFANTERRQHKVKDTGIRYIGCGVSGGYQAARAGPSMCPGGDQSALKEVLPLLEKVAAKDKNEKPCVGIVGKGGSGHYVKMVHNGIEHGMMSAICEAWGVMRKMGMGYEEIGDVLKEWNSSGELVRLIALSGKCQWLTSPPERDLSRLDRRRSITQARARLLKL
jgi:6-phosphogluconate dehydrogenase